MGIVNEYITRGTTFFEVRILTFLNKRKVVDVRQSVQAILYGIHFMIDWGTSIVLI